ncbi:MAG: V-type ATP synthase subunit D [Endomicrobia bacterium]|nr:V-type ATP synthase subunit D [Endomicrobiia bacterium]
MKIKVNPNRMNLLKLRRRLKFALRGHKLLKDKQEQLTKEFNNLITNLLEIRSKLETELLTIYTYIKEVLITTSNEVLETYLENLSQELRFEVDFVLESRFNVRYEKCKLAQIDKFKKIIIVNPYLNFVTSKLITLFNLILELTNLETLCELLAKELQTTRRRVNGLEYVIIPQIRQNIRFIIDKLNEFERTNITQLMRIKQLLE